MPVTKLEFESLDLGDVFYKDNTRYMVESIDHRSYTKPNPVAGFTDLVIVEASVRALARKGAQVWHVTFINLRPYSITKIVSKENTRKVRPYARRRNYPNVHVTRTSPLELTERNDCTVLALSKVLDIPYEDAHSYMAQHGRKHRKGAQVSRAYPAKGLQWHELGKSFTLGGLIKSGLLPQRAVIHTNSHVMAYVNGMVHDRGTVGSSSKVRGYYYVKA